MNLDKNYKGIDADLETSLEEYGFVARPITVDYPDEFFVIYKMGENQYGSGHIRESELDAIVNGTEWASDEDINSMLDTVSSTKEDWMNLSFEFKLNDLISYWGTENIMGTDYYPNDKNWAFEEIGLESEYDTREYAGGGRVNKMDKFISELAKKNTQEFSVNEYHDFRNKKFQIGVVRHYFTDTDANFSEFDNKLGDALNVDFDEYAKGGSLKDNLEKELRKLQRELNSSRLSTYREGDDSEEEMARRRERESKLVRFNEVLKTLNEIDKDSFSDGGETTTRTISYEDGGLAGLVDEEQMRDISFKIKVKTMPKKENIILHEVVEIEEYDAVGEKNVNLPKFHLIYGNNSLAIFDAFGVDEVAGLKREDAVEFIENLKKQGKTEKDGSFMAGLTNFSGDQIFMFFNVERLNFKGFANRVLPHEALHLSRYLISLYKNKWMRENLNTPNWWEDKRATFTELNDDNEEFFAETLERTTAIAMDGWFRATGSRCLADGGNIGLFEDGGMPTSNSPQNFFLSEKQLKGLTHEKIGHIDFYYKKNQKNRYDGVVKEVYFKDGFRPSNSVSFESEPKKVYDKLKEWVKIHNYNFDDIIAVKYANGGEVDDNDLEQLWLGYASAILFSESDSDTEEPLDENYSISDFDEETVKSSKDLIRKFYFENKEAIKESGLDLDTIGNDIWYTRAGHGAGFFDHSLDQDIEDKLTNGAKALGEYPTVETYDGKISVRGGRVFKKGGSVKSKAEKLFEERISYRWKNTDMGSGWLVKLDSPNDDETLEEELYLDIYDFDEDEYSFEDWKEDMLQTSKESFIDKYKEKYFDDFVEYIQRDKDDYYADGGGVESDNFKRFDVDFYDSSNANLNTSIELIIRQNSLKNAIKDAVKKAYELKKNYIEFYHRGFFLGSVNFAKSNDFIKGKFYKKFMSNDLYSDGGGVYGDYYAKGGDIENEFYIFEGIDHYSSTPLFRVESTSDSDAEYVGEWHTDRNKAEKELRELNGSSFEEDIYSNVDEELIRVSAEEIYNEQGFMNFRNLFLKLADTDERSGDIETANFRRALVKEYQEKQPRIK
jgi:hypothetical protein